MGERVVLQKGRGNWSWVSSPRALGGGGVTKDTETRERTRHHVSKKLCKSLFAGF